MSKADKRCVNDVILNLCSGLIRLTARFDAPAFRISCLGLLEIPYHGYINGKIVDSTFLCDRHGDEHNFVISSLLIGMNHFFIIHGKCRTFFTNQLDYSYHNNSSLRSRCSPWRSLTQHFMNAHHCRYWSIRPRCHKSGFHRPIGSR